MRDVTSHRPDKTSSRPDRLQGLRGRLILVLVGLALGFISAELALRLVGFSYSMYPERVEFGAPNPQQLASSFLEDKELFWVSKEYFTHTMPAAEALPPSLIFMGCSCTHRGMYPMLFQQKVMQHFPASAPPFSNFGVVGYTSHQGLRQLERDVLPLKPKVITIFYGWNDHWIGFGITDKDVSRIHASWLLYTIQQNSRLYQLLIKTLTAASIMTDQKPLRVSPEEFEANLVEMVRLCRADGIIPVLLTAPTSHVRGQEPAYLAERHILNLDDLVPLHQQYVEVVRRVADSEDALLCDLALEFERMPQDSVGSAYFWEDGIHLFQPGDAKIAEILFDCFEEADLLQHILE